VSVPDRNRSRSGKKRNHATERKDLAEVLAERTFGACEEKRKRRKEEEDEGLTIVETSACSRTREPVRGDEEGKSSNAFRLPQIEFLEPAGVDQHDPIDRGSDSTKTPRS